MPRRLSALQRRLTSRRRAMVIALLVLAIWWFWFRSPDLVTRVLFCETASCTPHERSLVMAVMQNRIGRSAFGSPTDLYAVVAQLGAFSCVDDDENGNWAKTRHPGRLTTVEQTIWQECRALAQHPKSAGVGPSGRPLVYYHDRSIAKPHSWDNQTWHAVTELATCHFVFYSIVPAKK